jgi:hypothetical protein
MLAELVRLTTCKDLGPAILNTNSVLERIVSICGDVEARQRQTPEAANLAVVVEAYNQIVSITYKSQAYNRLAKRPTPAFFSPELKPATKPATESTHYMSKSSQLINTSPFATASFIYGAVALDMTEPELLSALACVESDEAELAKLDPGMLSPYTKQRKETLVKARTAIGVLLDKLPAKPDTFTVKLPAKPDTFTI